MKSHDRAIKVLVVEDEHIILKYIVKKLREIDPDIEIIGAAEDAETAMELMRAGPPHILFTDIEMPVIDGIELIGWTKEHFPDTYVVVLSGYSNFEYAQAGIRYGIQDYLLKPVETEALKDTYERIKTKLLDKRRSEREAANSDTDIDGLLLKSRDEPDLASQIKKYVELCFNKPISMATLSEQFNYSPVYINKLFRKEMGISPMRYQTQLRIEKSKELLSKHKDADIKDIALAVGYDDSRYFSRVFRQMESMSPSEYSQQN